jgi:hypothetical protein
MGGSLDVEEGGVEGQLGRSSTSETLSLRHLQVVTAIHPPDNLSKVESAFNPSNIGLDDERVDMEYKLGG